MVVSSDSDCESVRRRVGDGPTDAEAHIAAAV